MAIESLRKDDEFDRVFREGAKHTGNWILAIVRKSQNSNKLGIVVSGKYGGAVKRNRIKRLIREAFRAVVDKLRAPVEIVVIPRQGAQKAKAGDITQDLSNIIARTQPKQNLP